MERNVNILVSCYCYQRLTLKAETILLGFNLLHLLDVQIKKASNVTFLVTVQVLPDNGLDERVEAHASVSQPVVVGGFGK